MRETLVNARIPQNFHEISTEWKLDSGCRTGERNARYSAQRYGLPLTLRKNSADFSAHAEAEDRKLRKDLTFGGPCFEGTLQKPTLVSESSPVAGAI